MPDTSTIWNKFGMCLDEHVTFKARLRRFQLCYSHVMSKRGIYALNHNLVEISVACASEGSSGLRHIQVII